MNENLNIGHGHVFQRPDGVKARCGGPGICIECSQDLANKKLNIMPEPKSLEHFFPGIIQDDGSLYYNNINNNDFMLWKKTSTWIIFNGNFTAHHLKLISEYVESINGKLG